MPIVLRSSGARSRLQVENTTHGQWVGFGELDGMKCRLRLKIRQPEGVGKLELQ